MNFKLFAFQRSCINELHKKIEGARLLYEQSKDPQVVSLQAPTGSGKTIIMSALLEEIYCGTENYAEQPRAIVVWLSDSPSLNEQSKKKIETKANKIRINQCITIEESSFDLEELEDGKIYFLNTQKLSKTSNLSSKGDKRQYTIWETLENTARNKGERLYFIIDEAHRGMKGKDASKATTIMQRFLKGSPEHNLSAMPLVIGMSATAERFNTLVASISSTIHYVYVKPSDVRDSGLLKDRIVVKFPDDSSKFSEMAVLQGAADEWKNKCDHWWQYCNEQHYEQVCPVLIIQVLAGNENKVSETNLDDVLAKIEERLAVKFNENEVVHTFGSVGDLQINGLKVKYVEPDKIVDDRRIKIVFFKENLSTGWDCPRAETMVSFRHAEDDTYVAQLLGRMIRTPRGSRIQVDESLNNVYLFLPYFNKDTVDNVIRELKDVEGGEIPVDISPEGMGESKYVPLTVNVISRHSGGDVDPFQQNLFDVDSNLPNESQNFNGGQNIITQITQTPSFETIRKSHRNIGTKPEATSVQLELKDDFDRKAIIEFINSQAYLKHNVRKVRINDYIRSMLDLLSLLTRYNIDSRIQDSVYGEMVEFVHNYIKNLKDHGIYEDKVKEILEYKLSTKIFDALGENIKNLGIETTTLYSDDDIERQARIVNSKIGNIEFCGIYGRNYFDEENPNGFKIDCILFANDDNCIIKLKRYAEDKYHELCDKYRLPCTNQSEDCRNEYSEIVRDGDAVSKDILRLPEEINAPEVAKGQEYFDHLYADKNTGGYKVKLTSWEEGTLKEEKKRSDFVCWLRNPSREKWALSIAYKMDNEDKPMYPDFIIVRKVDEIENYVIDILEPHDASRKDNLPKAKGLANYAKSENRIGRIQLIREVRDGAGNRRYKRLDMTKSLVQEKVLNAVNNEELDHIFDTDGYFEGE